MYQYFSIVVLCTLSCVPTSSGVMTRIVVRPYVRPSSSHIFMSFQHGKLCLTNKFRNQKTRCENFLTKKRIQDSSTSARTEKLEWKIKP